ncbi:hypothetical protein [Sulfuriroseicoccus oceanibius]|uniref:Uncharacterized protein n=1 Tax=Sulfuriroseicoccus oceanibius TaxID=2707525 RepID=A0A6B3LGK5_9BACT|nr:hypothetical protein [Sulfuriroseicoccus oceanibius]QQL45461.1 hypothetical protein G3M56_002390 [Sulfuriroseicoccus oceanibius]
MKHKTLIAILLGGIVIVGWVFVSLHFDTKKQMQTAQQILNSGGSVEDLEEAIGTSTHEYPASEVPEFVNSIDGFKIREGTEVRQYSMEGLPYWWVLVQVTKEDSEILWFRVAQYGH